MKILLVNPPIRLDAPPSCIPYGLATIAAILRNDGHEVDIYDINGLRNTRTEVHKALKYYSPWDMVGVSGLITTYNYQKWLIPRLRVFQPNARIIVGGGLATSNPELVEGADLVIHGEGEQIMHKICGGTKTFDNIDSYPFPAWDLLPIGTYLRNPVWGDTAGNSSQLPGVKVERSMNIISSRGCPFSCNFCYHLFGRKVYKQRSVSSVIAEVDELKKLYGVDFVGDVSDNMLQSKKWMLEFCAAMSRKNLKWGCHGRVDSAEPEVLAAMASAGCVWIGYGIESGSQTILDLMNKKTTVDCAYNAITETKKAGIFANTTFITGYIGESEETIQETIRFKKDLNIRCGSFFAQAYPGTVFYNQFKDRLPDDYISKLGDAKEFQFNFTDMPDEELFRLKALVDSC